jgi:two-component system LytT family response regulator
MSDVRVRAVVVDDEPAAREAVTTFLGEVAEVDVVAEARNGTEALTAVRAHRPDLLFLDVQMPGLSGFDVLEALGADVPRGVVLVTAHGEHALRAFEVHAVDYVTKPFGRPRFMAAVERALRRLEADAALSQRLTLESLIAGLRREGGEAEEVIGAVESSPVDRAAPKRLGVRLGNRTTLVDVDRIDWVEAAGDLVRVHAGEETHLLRSSLTDLARALGEDDFVRIHRATIVNLHRVRVLHREPDGSGSVTLDSGVGLRVARGRWEELEARLGLSAEG